MTGERESGRRKLGRADLPELLALSVALAAVLVEVFKGRIDQTQALAACVAVVTALGSVRRRRKDSEP